MPQKARAKSCVFSSLSIIATSNTLNVLFWMSFLNPGVAKSSEMLVAEEMK